MIIKPILADRAKKDGTKNIVIYLYHEASRKKDRIPTDYYINESDWENNQVKKSRPNSQFINPKIKQICLDIENYWLKDETMIPAKVKEWYQGKTDNSVIGYFETYIKQCQSGEILHRRKKTKLTKSYIKTLRQAKADAEKFMKKNHFTFESINEDFYNKFVSFMRDELNKRQNSISKIIKLFQTMVRRAFNDRVHDNRDYGDYLVPRVKVKKIKLTPEERDRVIILDLTEYPELIPEQERFIVAYYLMVRFGDSISIGEKNIVKKENKYFLSAFTEKTQKEILVPIPEIVYKILKRNKFQLKATNATSNKKLKKLAMLAKINENVTITEFKNGQKVETVKKKYELVETHTTRRSRARHLYFEGLNPDVIQKLGGWATREQMFEYIDIDLDDAAEVAAQHESFK